MVLDVATILSACENTFGDVQMVNNVEYFYEGHAKGLQAHSASLHAGCRSSFRRSGANLATAAHAKYQLSREWCSARATL
jgi:hypothetical protein